MKHKKTNEEFYSTLLQNIPDAILITDTAGKILHWLGGAEKIFGFTADEATNKNIKFFLRQNIQDLFITDEFSDGIFCSSKNNKEIIIRIVQKKEIDSGLFWICRDITTSKKIEKAMDSYNDDVHIELEKLIEEKTIDLKKLNEELEERVKVRTFELEEAQKQLVEQARQAGMAEIAINTLHSVGNILNSITTSLYVVRKNLKQPMIKKMTRANVLFESNLNSVLLTEIQKPDWQVLYRYYCQLEKLFRSEFEILSFQVNRMEEKVDEINYIIAEQNKYTNYPALIEIINIETFVEQTLKALDEIIKSNHVNVIKKISPVPELKLEKIKLNFIVVSILNNAIEALQENDTGSRLLTIHLNHAEGKVILKIEDNGSGISKDMLIGIFNQTYSPSINKLGITLHTCANYVHELGGTIKAESDGPGCGSLFTLMLNIENEGIDLKKG